MVIGQKVITMVDIEDVDKEVGGDVRLSTVQDGVKLHYRQSKHDPGLEDLKQDAKQSAVPGIHKVWLKTYGCSHNVSDSEYMEGLLTHYGYEMVPQSDQADVWVVNSCTVKDPSQAAFMHVVQQAKTQEKPIVVAGCVSQADRNLKGLEDVSVIGITQIDRVVEAVEQTLQGHVIKLLAKKELPLLDLPKIRKNPLVEIIPLSTGCLGSCTYCKTKQARGKLGSYAKEAILQRAQTVISEGVSEIWLSSEDTGAYGLDIGTNIAELLEEMVALIPADSGVMLRVGMTNPPYILKHREAIARILNHPNVYAFIHIPVQAGSNPVLDAMNREYHVEEFEYIVDYLLEHVPDVTIATDVICGFPNESEEDFDQTLRLVEKYRFGILNISQFYPRPGTPAAKMKRINTQIVKNRSRRLTTIFESFQPYENYLGRTMNVYFNIEVSDDGQHSVGHSKAYVKVLVPFDANLPGTCYMVEVISVHRFHVVGRIVSDKIYDVSRNVSDPKKLRPVSLVPSSCTNGQCGDSCGQEAPLRSADHALEDVDGESAKGSSGWSFVAADSLWAGTAVVALVGMLAVVYISSRRR